MKKTVSQKNEKGESEIKPSISAAAGIDIEILRQIKERAKLNREGRARRSTERCTRLAPIVYVPSGTTLLRFYMDCEHDVTRALSRHKMEKFSVPCLDSCPICTHLSGMENKCPDFPLAWRFRTMTNTIAYASIFSCTETERFVKLQTPVLLMGGRRLGQELDDHIADMDDRELSRMFDPLAEHNLWELNSGNGEFSLSPSFQTGTTDPLPASLYPLKECIHREGQAPTTEQISQFIRLIDDAYRIYIDGGLNEERDGIKRAGE